jgi:hypothetical protein
LLGHLDSDQARTFRGRAWSVSLEPESDAFSETPYTPVTGEIIIHAANLERAQYALEVILATDALLQGSQSFFGEGLDVVPEEPPTDPSEVEAYQRFLTSVQGSSSALARAAILATRMSYRRKYQYSLFKLRLSYRLCSVHAMDLDPSQWRSPQAVFDHVGYHVSIAFAIQAAYSAIEELGLEIRASKQRPSTIDGTWNPAVLSDLQDRLSDAGIEIPSTVVWHRRGNPSSVERHYPPPRGKRAPWAWRAIRDVEMALEDAILYSSRLRSSVAAHRLRHTARSLSFYDATNVQHVARRLLLGAVEGWHAPSAQ